MTVKLVVYVRGQSLNLRINSFKNLAGVLFVINQLIYVKKRILPFHALFWLSRSKSEKLVCLTILKPFSYVRYYVKRGLVMY